MFTELRCAQYTSNVNDYNRQYICISKDVTDVCTEWIGTFILMSSVGLYADLLDITLRNFLFLELLLPNMFQIIETQLQIQLQMLKDT
jgi:choline kinase